MLCSCGKKVTGKFCSNCGQPNKKQIKNPNGHGSVYKLPGRRRRPWIARITTGWTEEGKRVYQTIGYFESRSEGLDALALNRINPVSPNSNLTLEELYKEWSKVKYPRISKSTTDNYKAAWKYLSKLENTKFKDLRTNQWQGIVDDCHKNSLSKSTLNKVKVVVTMLYNYAIQNDILPNNKNYGQFIVLPKEEKQERDIFTDININKMFKNAKEVEWIDTILIMIYTGLRVTEMLTLTKFNVDMNQGIITGGIKTDAGKDRIIPIHSKIYPFIKRWYNKEGETLIHREDGKKMSANYYRKKKYYPALQILKLPELTPHSCRHKFASMMADKKVDTLYIQKIIGHKDYAFTADKYTHINIEELKKAINKL